MVVGGEMKKWARSLITFFVRSVLAGALVAIAAVTYFVCIDRYDSTILGAVLFSFSLLMIVVLDLKLFTGATALLADTPLKKYWTLPMALFGNFVGVWLIALCVNFSALSELIGDTASLVAQAKLDAGWLSTLLLAFLCGFCISFSIVAGKEAMKKGIQPALFIALPVVIFAVCGFEHSIANIAYFMYGRIAMSWQVLWFFVLVILGNLLGGPLVLLAKKFVDKEDTETSKS
jgi:formate/nitrite transporter FocA (FNT family)